MIDREQAQTAEENAVTETAFAAAGQRDAWLRLRRAVKALHQAARVTPPGAWQHLDDDAVWCAVVGQVVVIQGSKPWKAIQASWDRLGLDWASLTRVEQADGAEGIEHTVQAVFAKYGVRFPAKKAIAVAENFEKLRTRGGPRAFVQAVGALESERERCDAVSCLSQISLKGGRDLLMDLGAARNVIALDARILGLLRAAGLPDQVPKNRKRYEAVESEILRQVADPLGLDGVVVDRTLFQLADDVKAALA